MTTLNDAITKAHEHANKTQLDTYDKTQTELLAVASKGAQNKVDTLKATVDKKADKATTLAGYGITDAYNKTEVDAKHKVIEDNLNTKVDAATVDSKIAEAKPGILTEAKEQLETRVGDIPEDSTIKSYIDSAVGAGGADVGEAIETAKQEAINTSKLYTDSLLTITEF